MANASTPIVYVIDGDRSVRESLESTIRSAGGLPKTFSSASEFLSRPHPMVPSCLILDINLPDLSGLELQERVAAERRDISIIFLSESFDVSATVKAIKRGALEFMLKPADGDVLLNAIRSGIRHSEAALGRETQMHMLRTDYSALTPREREIVQLLAEGKSTKEVAVALGLSVKTAETHRSNIMRKLQLHSVSDLVLYAVRNNIVHVVQASIE